MKASTSILLSGLVSAGFLCGAAWAAQPVPKSGMACPSGYRDDPKSGYCIPRDASAKMVVPIKGGTCPSNFRAEPKTGYCIAR